jgi:hypothetical protein
MTEYVVTAKIINIHEILVEADSLEQAIEIAQDTEININNYAFIDEDIEYTANPTN